MSTGGATDPTIVGLVRTALGAASLLAAAQMLKLPRPAWRQVPLWPFAVFGVAGAAFQVWLFTAFSVVGVTVTVAVTVCAPVLIVAVADALWRRRAPKRRMVLAILVASGGVLLALPASDLREASLRGGTLLAGASLAFAALAVASRAITRHLDPVRAAGFGLFASALALAGVLGVGVKAPLSDLSSLLWLPGQDLAILLYIGIAATGGAYLAFVLGMNLCGSASTGLAATMIEPGVAAILATLVLRERLTLNEAGGCALMMLAMMLISRLERARGGRAQLESDTALAERSMRVAWRPAAAAVAKRRPDFTSRW